MAWTANLVDKRQEANGIYLNVNFTDGVKSFGKEILVNGWDLNSVKRTVQSEINSLNNNDTILSSLNEGAISAPDPDPTPTQAELDQQTWLQDYNRWVNVKTKLIDTGILTGNETQVVALKTKVQTNFKPAYLSLI